MSAAVIDAVTRIMREAGGLADATVIESPDRG